VSKTTSCVTYVRERLRHLYGDDQQVDAGWMPDERFGVRIALPLRREQAAA
jgi:two-component system sensor histidine kinase AlgZ